MDGADVRDKEERAVMFQTYLECYVRLLCRSLDLQTARAKLMPTSYMYCDMAPEGPISLNRDRPRLRNNGSRFHGLLWKGPEVIVRVNYKPILSSERAPHSKKLAIV
jgi:hypothetical protein